MKRYLLVVLFVGVMMLALTVGAAAGVASPTVTLGKTVQVVSPCDSSAPADAYEGAPGDNDPAHARDITSHITHDSGGMPLWPTQPYVEIHTISSVSTLTSDVDWYKFTVTANDLSASDFSLMIDAVSWDGSLDTVIEVYGPCANAAAAAASAQNPTAFGAGRDPHAITSAEQASDDSPWTPPSAQVTIRPDMLSAPGTYYFRVRPYYYSGFPQGYNAYSKAGSYYMRFKVGQITRLEGATRIMTAVNIGDEGWRTSSSVASAVIACSNNYPDALAGSTLAGAVDGPLLLQPFESYLDDAVKSFLARKHVHGVYILGSTGVVSQGTENDLVALGYHVKRVKGADRIGTAIAAARESRVVSSIRPKFAIVAYGYNFPDAMAASSIAYADHVPVLLTHGDYLDTSVKNAITEFGITDAVLVGGTGVLKPAVQDQLATKLGAASHAYRIAGVDRYETAKKFAHWASDIEGPGVHDATHPLVGTPWRPEMLSTLSYAFVGFATGENFPDALAGGAFCGKARASLLLTKKNSVPPILFGADGEILPGQTQYFTGKAIKRSYLFGSDMAVSTPTGEELDSDTGWNGF